MARYKREFLVPYLADLSALHMTKQKLKSNYEQALDNKIALERELAALKAPDLPILEDTGLQIAGLAVGIFCIFVSWFDIVIISFLAGVVGWMCTISAVIWIRSVKRSNAEKEWAYQHAYERYTKQRDSKKESLDGSIMVSYALKEIYETNAKEIDAVLNKMNAANVIPRRYRDDIYAVFYLYDWFSTGGSDDLDMALNTYVLEEIKDRLDVVIHQQSLSLINQRVMIANQYRSMELQEKYHREMVAKVDQLQLTAEEHSQYLQMIEGNTAAIAYFAAVDYIKKL